MLRQILSQIWYYRRSSLWLLCELVVIFITLVNEIWTAHYRAHSTPYGYDYEGVYIAEMEPLSDGQPGYAADNDTYEASAAAYTWIGVGVVLLVLLVPVFNLSGMTGSGMDHGHCRSVY